MFYCFKFLPEAPVFLKNCDKRQLETYNELKFWDKQIVKFENLSTEQ